MVNKKNISTLISNGIEQFIVRGRVTSLPFYGEFALGLNFVNSPNMPTCGVNIRSNGMNFYFNDSFLHSLGTVDGIIKHSDRVSDMTPVMQNEYQEALYHRQRQVNFIIIHELYHLLFSHPQRTTSGGFDAALANIAQDMIINSIIYADIDKPTKKNNLSEHKRVMTDIPRHPDNAENRLNGSANKSMALFIPKEYYDEGGDPIFEVIYTWLVNKKNEHDEKKGRGNKPSSSSGSGDKKGSDKPSSGDKYVDTNGREIEGSSYSLSEIFDKMGDNNGEFMDCHIKDEVSKELRDVMINEKLASLRSRGLVSSDMEKTINKLRKKKKDHLREIKKAITGSIMGTTKIPTITRPNRRGIKGIKGRKKISNSIVVILDTSGSMYGQFEKVLNYIFQNGVEIHMLQVDTDIKQSVVLRSMRDFDRLNVKGLGGTILQPAIDYVNEDQILRKLNIVLLTDGVCDTLDMSGIKGKVLGITCGAPIPISNKPRGGYKEIVANSDYD